MRRLSLLLLLAVTATGPLDAAGSGTTPAAPAKPGATTSSSKPSTKPATTTRSAPATKVSTTPKPGTAPTAATTPGQIAHQVTMLEEAGGYESAVVELRKLRGRVARDADLEIALALNFARSGALDSAAAVLAGPTLEAALADTTDFRRFDVYGWKHENTYLDGRFDGWWWYVVRGRTEVAAARERWPEALQAARQCVRARPLAGVEWHMLATCAAQVRAWPEADSAAAKAVQLSPLLPEAHYLAGLLAWRSGRRNVAQERFRAAVELDSTYRAAAVALVRSRLGVSADPMPTTFLTGIRRAALLSSPVRPKYDEFLQLDAPAKLLHNPSAQLADSLRTGKAFQVSPLALIDTTGRVAYVEDPWTSAGTLDDEAVGRIMASFAAWRFEPARRHGEPQPLWMQLDMDIQP